ncbi:hypothetical protein [Inquilinus limosus]|uniref:hypothetical protein n=1 Tax=Inquilinus limosus TaxID=171674 RepID=UPI0012DF69D0|nr:hypothetical protein [Inquilinus limosus]
MSDGVSLTTFLKICSMQSTGRKISEIDKLANRNGGHDYYNGVKKIAPALAQEQFGISDVPKKLAYISRQSQRQRNEDRVKQFMKWWKKQIPSPTFLSPPSYNKSPKDCSFILRIKPEISYTFNGIKYTLHIWNTEAPKLNQTIAGIGIYTMIQYLRKGNFSDSKFQMIDLNNGKLFDESSVTNDIPTIFLADMTLFNHIWERVKL